MASDVVRQLVVPAALVARADLSLTDVNDHLADLLGVQARTLVGRSIGEILRPGRARMALELARSITTEGRSMDVALGLGRRELHGRLTFGPGPADDSLLVIYADHSDLHDEASSLRGTLSALAAANSNLGGELQAELTVVAGYSRMLATAGERITVEERIRLHQRVAESAQRAAGLSRGLGEDQAAGPPVVASLTDVMSWVERATALRLADAEAVLVWDIVRDVTVDAAVLRQVLVRLVEDALEREDTARPHHVHVALRPVNDGLEVVVTDSAPDGADELDRLIDPGAPPSGSLRSERAIATHVGGWLSSVPHANGTRHVLWLPELA